MDVRDFKVDENYFYNLITGVNVVVDPKIFIARSELVAHHLANNSKKRGSRT